MRVKLDCSQAGEAVYTLGYTNLSQGYLLYNFILTYRSLRAVTSLSIVINYVFKCLNLSLKSLNISLLTDVNGAPPPCHYGQGTTGATI